MARREWAAKLIADDTFTVFLGRDNVQVVGKNASEDHLRKEHARAVRIVKAAIANEKKEMADDPHNEGLYEYTIDKLRELLTALQRGRGKGGVK